MGAEADQVAVDRSGTAAIAQTGIAAEEQALALLVFTVVASIGVTVPLVIDLAMGDRAAELLGRLETWMADNNAVIMAAILLVMFLAFRSPRPLLLVVLSVGTGVACGLSVCALVFGKVHLMTLVFGASLVGVAEDYGIHYFASRQARPHVERHELLEELKPGLFLALVTSVAGYVMLAITPMPGLRQVALF